MHLSPSERAALDALIAFVSERFGDRLRELALFGSRARGDAHEESDVDVLVVVDDLTPAEGGDVAGHCGHPILTQHNVRISAFVVSTAYFNELRARERLIASEIDRDRVELRR